ncbi:hypothetical protein [Amycolatopsis circi]|uniref:hypothetical protein n=1 Tax=Amycolatopsis circi TaxID=871959 RepID=UPI000E22FCC3|nr:hypothetical protein [Amycolatopsis circi]
MNAKMMQTTRGAVRRYLLEYGEEAAAEWIVSSADDEFIRVCGIGSWLLAAGPSTPSGASMTLANAAAAAAVCVHEEHPRKLARSRRKKLPELSAEEERRIRSESYPMALSFSVPSHYGVTEEIKEFWADPGPGA